MRKTLLILMTFAMVSATVHFGINDETFVDNNGTVTFDVMFSIDNGEELAGFQFNLLPAGAIDFSDAGAPVTNRRYMIPPKASNTVRNSFTGLVSGAMIYNTSINKLQVYNGSSWETVTSS